MGNLLLGKDCYLPATPHGVIELIKRSGIETSGKNCVIVGRSNIVGKPLSMLMLQKSINATVTVCHSHTQNLPQVCRRADILIVAIGQPEMITAEYVKEGATVIDVGIHRLDAPDGAVLVLVVNWSARDTEADIGQRGRQCEISKNKKSIVRGSKF